MAHLVERMAYVGEVPWHGLGSKLEPGSSIDVWCKAAGLDWTVDERNVFGSERSEGGYKSYYPIDGYKLLRRSDNGYPLGIVSDQYKVVQPPAVLDFFKGLAEAGQIRIETAGSLRLGKRIWALADTHQTSDFGGGDVLKRYVLLATGFTGDFATVAMHTAVRVVCNNTMQIALAGNVERVSIPHNIKFDPKTVRSLLGLETSTVEFDRNVRQLISRNVSTDESLDFFAGVYYDRSFSDVGNREQNKIAHLNLIRNAAPGQETETARGTAWGLVNAVTHYEDFSRPERGKGGRLLSAWFGEGRRIKKRAWEEALELAA
jgi:phage/plasmid-like protein (TIGR03299 family)